MATARMTEAEKRLWEGMTRRSFQPRQFWDLDDLPDHQSEDRIMWVYLKKASDPQNPYWFTYEVGFFDPTGKWHKETTHESAQEAAERCHWLNGGQK